MTDNTFRDLESKGSIRIRPRRWVRLAAIWGIWTFIGIVFTLQSYFTSYRSEKPTPLFDSLYLQMTWSYLWALTTPLVLWAASRLPIERNNWMRSALLHVPLSIVLSVFVTALGHVVLWLYWGWSLGRPFSFERMGRFVVANFSEGIGIYLLIALTSYAFSYYQKFRESQVQTLKLEAQLSQAQLHALKMQLHPHFLFNTLHSISALLNKDTESARRMITRLGDFLRLTLDNSGSQEVTLQKEIEFLSCYLEIERIRFQDRLVTRVDVPHQALDAKVPNLILQPIVENALEHGVSKVDGEGRIEIAARRDDEDLLLTVRDNGAGVDNTQAGVGLTNTRERLSQLYGDAARFQLSSADGGGTLASISIPFHTSHDLRATEQLDD